MEVTDDPKKDGGLFLDILGPKLFQTENIKHPLLIFCCCFQRQP